MIIDCHVHLNNYHEEIAVSVHESLARLQAAMQEADVSYALVLTSYLVANAIILPISGWLAAGMGRKRFYLSGVALVTASSFCWARLATNAPRSSSGARSAGDSVTCSA